MDDFIRAFMGLPTRGERPRFYEPDDNQPHGGFQDPDIDRFIGVPPTRFYFRPFFFSGSFGDPHQGNPFGDPHHGGPFGGPHHGGPYGDPHSDVPRESPPFHGGIHSDNNDMFRHFDDMFRSFDEAFRHMGVASHPSIEYRQRGREQQTDSLRDKMLKKSDPNPYADRRRIIIEPPSDGPPPMVKDPSEIPRKKSDIHPSEKVDRDIDAEVKDADIDAILQSMNQPTQQVQPLRPQVKSRFKSVSIRTYRGPDGKYEQEKTIKDGEGNVEKVVTKRVGEQEHSVISKSDKTGIKEKIENFVNMDESDKPTFEKLWEAPSRRPPARQIQPPPAGATESIDHESQSMFNKLFGNDFPFFKPK